MAEARDSAFVPVVKTLIFTVLVPGILGLWVPLRWIPRQPPLHGSAALGWLGVPLMTLGAAGYLWCAWHFAVTGRGTPAPIDPPKTLVVRGLYRYVRNPMYVSVFTFVAGLGLWLDARNVLLYALAVLALFHVFVLVVEEPLLRGKFGGAYLDYCRRVPRWLPRLRGRG